MPVRVRVQNFQSIEDSTVVIDGFTVVTGPNNSGKTAFLRAFKGVFTNPSAGPLVRHGASHLTVTLTFDDGNVVVWEKGWTKPGQKGGTVNRYTLNGKVFDNVGRSPPEEVLALGVCPVAAGSDNLWPQIADQFAGVLFLVNSPGSVIAEAVADVDRVGKLSSALKLAESDRRGVNSTLKVRRKDLQRLELDVETFKGLDTITVAVSQTEEALSTLEGLYQEIHSLEKIRDSWNRSRSFVDRLAGVRDIHVPPQTALQGAESLRDTLVGVQDLQRRWSATRAALSSLDGIQNVEVPPAEDVSRAHKVQKTLQAVTALRDRYQGAHTKVSRSAGFKESLSALPGGLEGHTTVVGRARELSYLMEVRDRLEKARGNVSKLEAFLEENLAQRQEAQEAVMRMLGDLGECPTCGTVHTPGEHP